MLAERERWKDVPHMARRNAEDDHAASRCGTHCPIFRAKRRATLWLAFCAARALRCAYQEKASAERRRHRTCLHAYHLLLRALCQLRPLSLPLYRAGGWKSADDDAVDANYLTRHSSISAPSAEPLYFRANRHLACGRAGHGMRSILLSGGRKTFAAFCGSGIWKT